uniref:Uncharacterized protein n=1 Tax=Lygus hesperus TaxID=30085 RepID=A0A0K8T3K8_LYGHE
MALVGTTKFHENLAGHTQPYSLSDDQSGIQSLKKRLSPSKFHKNSARISPNTHNYSASLSGELTPFQCVHYDDTRSNRHASQPPCPVDLLYHPKIKNPLGHLMMLTPGSLQTAW